MDTWLPARNVCQVQKLSDVDSELAAMLFSRLREIGTAFQHTNREASITRQRKLERMLSVRRREAQAGDCGKKASLIMVRPIPCVCVFPLFCVYY